MSRIVRLSIRFLYTSELRQTSYYRQNGSRCCQNVAPENLRLNKEFFNYHQVFSCSSCLQAIKESCPSAFRLIIAAIGLTIRAVGAILAGHERKLSYFSCMGFEKYLINFFMDK